MVPKGSLSHKESQGWSEKDVVEEAELLAPAPESLPLTSLPQLCPYWAVTDLRNCRPEHTLDTAGKVLVTACSRMNSSIGSTYKGYICQNYNLRTPSFILASCGFLCTLGKCIFGVFCQLKRIPLSKL